MERNETITMTNEQTGEEREVEIVINYSIISPHTGCMYLNNGDPGHPAEGGELEIESIYDEDGNELDEDVLTDAICDYLYDSWDPMADDPNAP